MNAIAASELRMLFRNRLVAVTAIGVPLIFGLGFALGGRFVGTDPGLVAALQIVIMSAMGLYVTATTTLAGRRQILYLKRLRSGTTSDGAILTGLVLPVILVNLVQVVLVLVVLSVATTPPTQAAYVALAVVLAQLMFAGLALGTAGVTNSPEHAQVTTLPLLFLSMAGAVFSALPVLDHLLWLKLLVPGGALAQLAVAGWTDPGAATLIGAIAVAIAWTFAGIGIAQRWFRWEPRR